MKKNLTVVILLLIVVGCSSGKMKKIEKKSFEIIKEKKLEKNINLYHKVEYFNNKIIIYQNFGSGNNIYEYDMNLNLIKSRKYTKGKGPGEFQWFNNMTGVNNKLYCTDGMKNTIEIFNSDFKYEDTIIPKGNFRFYSGMTDLVKIDNYFYISPTFPHVMIKVNEKNSKIEKFIKSNSDEMSKMGMYNIVKIDSDGEYIYMIPIGREKQYTISKYDRDLDLVWEKQFDDGLVNELSLKIVELGNRFEANGAPPTMGLIVDDGKIYNLRGVGGYKEWTREEGKVKFENLKIKSIDNGFVDVFDSDTGKMLYRIEGDFLNTQRDYQMLKVDDRFYFLSYYNDNNSDKSTGNSAKIYVAKVVN
ncbi:MAG TPA: hypothetical protein VKN74_00465 [Candidatus Mcinerneyibacterium sp.]|nr:hypothetical protein [Candidatus Mcinerneyibacterium sp.]